MNGLGARRILRSEIISTLRGRFDRHIVVKQTTIQAIDIYCEKMGGEKRPEREGFVQAASFERSGGKGRGERRVRLADEAISEFPCVRLLGDAEHFRACVNCCTGSPPVRKLWGGVLPRSDTSAFPRGGYGGFGVLSISVALCRTRESAASDVLSISVAFCRSRVRVRLWFFCRYLSHYVGRG